MANQIGIRMAPNEIALLKKVSHARGEDLSDFVRRSIRTELARLSYLSPNEKKALGVLQKAPGPKPSEPASSSSQSVR